MSPQKIYSKSCIRISEKTEDISRRQQRFPREMTSEKRAQKFHMDDYPDLGSASEWLNQISKATRQIRNSTQIWVVTSH